MTLLPTRRRLKLLERFLQSAQAADTTSPGLIIVDEKDFAENEPQYVELEKYFPNGWQYRVTKAEGMGPKIREVWSELKSSPPAWVNILNDDHIIKTKKWDTKLSTQLNGGNFLTCNDHWRAPTRAAGATMFSWDLIEAFGFPLFPPQIDHLGIDDVWEYIGKNTGSWQVDMSVVIEHDHVYLHPETMDETHIRIYGRGKWDQSPQAQAAAAAFQEWLKADAPGVMERVRELRKAKGIKPLDPRTIIRRRGGTESEVRVDGRTGKIVPVSAGCDKVANNKESGPSSP